MLLSEDTSIQRVLPDPLCAFLSGDFEHLDETWNDISIVLMRAARRAAPDLSHELQEDMVQRVSELLCLPTSSKYDSTRGSPHAYIKCLMQRSATDVRASYAYPGQRTRSVRGSQGETMYPASPLSLDSPLSISPESGNMVLGDVVVSQADPYRECLDRLAAHEIMELARRTAPDEVFAVLQLAYAGEHNFKQSAALLGIERTTLRRRVDRWVGMHQHLIAS